MLSSDFLIEFKCATERQWSGRSIDPTVYGFQFQQGTRWNPGLSDEEIAKYEGILIVRFPHDFKVLLRAMNGTDIPTLNIYGYCGEAPRQSIGVYSYPRDLEIVRKRITEVGEYRTALVATLAEQGFDLPAEAKLIPLYAHRCVVCTSDLVSSVVLSIADGEDAIV